SGGQAHPRRAAPVRGSAITTRVPTLGPPEWRSYAGRAPVQAQLRARESVEPDLRPCGEPGWAAGGPRGGVHPGLPGGAGAAGGGGSGAAPVPALVRGAGGPDPPWLGAAHAARAPGGGPEVPGGGRKVRGGTAARVAAGQRAA